MDRPPEHGHPTPRRQHRFPRRPRRLELLFTSVRPFYFVTFNTYDRYSLLAREEVQEVVCFFCHRATDYNIAVGRYVIMPDHVHLFVVFPPTGLTLSKWIQALRTVIGKELLRLGTQKPHWQEGSFDHVLRSAESYAEKARAVAVSGRDRSHFFLNFAQHVD